MTLLQRIRIRLCRHTWTEWEPGVHPSWVAAANGDETTLGMALVGQDVWTFSAMPLDEQVTYRECVKCADIQHAPATREGAATANDEALRLID